MQSDKLFTAALRDAREKAEKIAGELNAKVASVFAVSPIAFGGIKDILFGHEEIDLPNGAALDKFVVTGSPLTDKGDRYSFEPLNLSQRLHVIFLIEPARK